jgi:hypothetical protein
VDDSPERDAPDYWVIYGGLEAVESAHVPPGRTIFVTGEPAAVHAYRPGFLAQFGVILTSQPAIRGKNVVHTQPALPWHVGVRRDSHADVVTYDYDGLRAAHPVKTHDLSVVCSSKTDTDGQRRRVAFVEQLERHFGARLHRFGRGVHPIADKWDAVAPYRFHVSLENSQEPDYWTEKLGDAYLGLAVPIYWGCPNIRDYFPAASYVSIDLDDAGASIATIARVLEEGVTEERERAVERARLDVLDRYNLFPMLASMLGRARGGTARTVTLRPEADFPPPSHASSRGRTRRLADHVLRRR